MFSFINNRGWRSTFGQVFCVLCPVALRELGVRAQCPNDGLGHPLWLRSTGRRDLPGGADGRSQLPPPGRELWVPSRPAAPQTCFSQSGMSAGTRAGAALAQAPSRWKGWNGLGRSAGRRSRNCNPLRLGGLLLHPPWGEEKRPQNTTVWHGMSMRRDVNSLEYEWCSGTNGALWD